jgi:dTDP-4-amino-4,6-dideoxygalactose transaminase
MSATTMAVLHAGAVTVFCDVDPRTWIMEDDPNGPAAHGVDWWIPVDLYGLTSESGGTGVVVDAAQALRKHGGNYTEPAFTSYSFQSSKILALGEGGMLATNDERLATKAREFSSLGYRMRADQPRIDTATLKSPMFERHHTLGWNYRMSDLVAAEGLCRMEYADELINARRQAAAIYREAIADCDWLTPQHVPEGWGHDYWCYAVAVDAPERWEPLAQAIERHGGERPYAAWRLTYQEPAFRHLAHDGACPIAEELQPRLMQFQTNKIEAAEKNAKALRLAIREVGG